MASAPLDQEQVAQVLRRAAELDGQLERPSSGLDPVVVEEAAVEAGLSRGAVRQALAELRAGALPGSDTRRSLVGPASVVVQRALPAPSSVVRAELERFLRSQLFARSRQVGERQRWVRREGLVPNLRRTLDFKRNLVLTSVRSLDLSVVDQDDEGRRTIVRLEADLGAVLRQHRAALVGGAAMGGVVAGGSVVAVGLQALVLSAPAGAGIAWSALAGARSSHRRTTTTVETVFTASSITSNRSTSSRSTSNSAPSSLPRASLPRAETFSPSEAASAGRARPAPSPRPVWASRSWGRCPTGSSGRR